MTPDHTRSLMRGSGAALALMILLLAFVLSACHRGHPGPGPGHLVPSPGHLK